MYWRVKFYVEATWRARAYTVPVVGALLALLILVWWPLDTYVPTWVQVVITIGTVATATVLCSPDANVSLVNAWARRQYAKEHGCPRCGGVLTVEDVYLPSDAQMGGGRVVREYGAATYEICTKCRWQRPLASGQTPATEDRADDSGAAGRLAAAQPSDQRSPGNSVDEARLGVRGKPRHRGMLRLDLVLVHIPLLRVGAASRLAEARHRRASKALINLLTERNDLLRYTAARGLGLLGGSDGVEHLIRALQDRRNFVREQAAWALGKIGDPRAAAPLAGAFREACVEDLFSDMRKDDPQFRVYSPAKGALIALKSASVGPLIALLDGARTSVRRNVAECLGELGDPRAVQTLIDLLEDKTDGVRVSAAVALGRLASREAVPRLMCALRDDSSWVRSAAASVLGSIGDGRALEALQRAGTEDEVESSRAEARVAAAKLLDQMPSNKTMHYSVPLRANEFQEFTTSRPEAAVCALLDGALPASEVLRASDIQTAYQEVSRAWGSRGLFRGGAHTVGELVMRDLERLAGVPGFADFTVLLGDGGRFAQVNALYPTGGFFVGVRVWRSESEFFVCGNRDFRGC